MLVLIDDSPVSYYKLKETSDVSFFSDLDTPISFEKEKRALLIGTCSLIGIIGLYVFYKLKKKLK